MTESDAKWGGRGAGCGGVGGVGCGGVGWGGVGQVTARQCMAGQGWVGWVGYMFSYRV